MKISLHLLIILVFLVLITDFFPLAAALSCHVCSYLENHYDEENKNCKDNPQTTDLLSCDVTHVANYFGPYTDKTNPPVCITAEFILDSGDSGVERYCGFPVNNTVENCTISTEAAKEFEPVIGLTDKGVKFTFCNDSDGCNIVQMDEQLECRNRGADSRYEASSHVVVTLLITTVFSVVSFAK